MKQKNVLLMVVAVGCGLVAAFLTSQMNAKSASTDSYEVIVAAKDLPVGTFLTRDELAKLVKIKKLPKDALPPAFVTSTDDLVDKRTTRPIRVEEPINPQDVTKGGTLTLPPGKDMVSLSVNIEQAVAGFVTPGAKVDILAAAKEHGTDSMVAFPLLINMMVMAVDQRRDVPTDNGGTFAQLSTISLAVDREQALLIQLAKARNVTLGLVLRHPDKPTQDEKWNYADVEKILRGGDKIAKVKKPADQEGDGDEPRESKGKKAETVKLPVAREDIPAGTMITKDLLAEKFDVVDVPGPAPANAVLDLEDLLDRSFLNGVAANQWVPRSFVGVPTPKAAPRDGLNAQTKPAPSAEKPAPRVVPVQRRTHDVLVQTGSGSRTYRYEEHKPGEWKHVGEVDREGNLRDSSKGEAAEPKPAPEPQAAPKPAPTPEPQDDAPRPVRPNLD